MTKKKAKQIVDKLSLTYPDAKPALKFNSQFELLVAVVLSAQCTDKRVNEVTEKLFKRANTPYEMAKISQEELESYIFSCGLYHSKAEHIISASRDIVQKFNGNVPDNLEDLRSLAGVGRKTANVVYSVGFNGDAIAVDTHVFRVSNRIGLTSAQNPLETEKGLMQIIDKSEWSKMHHFLIFHGRQICHSRKPNCIECTINDLCEYKDKTT